MTSRVHRASPHVHAPFFLAPSCIVLSLCFASSLNSLSERVRDHASVWHDVPHALAFGALHVVGFNVPSYALQPRLLPRTRGAQPPRSPLLICRAASSWRCALLHTCCAAWRRMREGVRAASTRCELLLSCSCSCSAPGSKGWTQRVREAAAWLSCVLPCVWWLSGGSQLIDAVAEVSGASAGAAAADLPAPLTSEMDNALLALDLTASANLSVSLIQYPRFASVSLVCS